MRPQPTEDPELAQSRADRARIALRRGTNIDRTVFFSDAVMAIAMTLLVLDLKLPDLGRDVSQGAFDAALVDRIGPVIAFVLSFVMVARTWLIHHRRFEAIIGYDARLQQINLTLLFFVAFLPVPTGILFAYTAQSAWPPVLYAATMVGIFGSLDLLWAYARRAGLMDPAVGPALYRATLTSAYPVILVFGLSIPLAFFSARWAVISWFLIAPATVVWARISRARFDREMLAEAPADPAAGAPASTDPAAGTPAAAD